MILPLGRQRQVDLYEVKPSLVYNSESRTDRQSYIVRLCLKKKEERRGKKEGGRDGWMDGVVGVGKCGISLSPQDL